MDNKNLSFTIANKNTLLPNNDFRNRAMSYYIPATKYNPSTSMRSFSNFRELTQRYSYKRIYPDKDEYSSAENIKGSLLMITSAFIYALLLMYQKFLFNQYPEVSFGQQNIIRGAVMIIIYTYLIIKDNESFVFNKETNLTLAKRILYSFFGELLLFMSTEYLRINTSSTFYLLYAVICSIVSGVVLNEVVTKQDIIIAIAFFLSACLIVKPFFGQGADTFGGMLMGMGSAICFCMMVIYHKFLHGEVSTFTINFYLGVCYLIEGLFTHLFGNLPFNYDKVLLFHLLILSLIYAISCYIFILAINNGKVSYVLPFENTNIVFSLLLGHFVLGESCDSLDLLGTFLILGLCAYRSIVLINEENQENKSEVSKDKKPEEIS